MTTLAVHAVHTRHKFFIRKNELIRFFLIIWKFKFTSEAGRESWNPYGYISYSENDAVAIMNLEYIILLLSSFLFILFYFFLIKNMVENFHNFISLLIVIAVHVAWQLFKKSSLIYNLSDNRKRWGEFSLAESTVEMKQQKKGYFTENSR